MAICYLKMKDEFSAAESCKEALNIDSKNVKALYRLA